MPDCGVCCGHPCAECGHLLSCIPSILPTPANQRPGEAWRTDQLSRVTTYAKFASSCAGVTYGNGVYRIHDGRSARVVTPIVLAAFPRYAQHVSLFGVDWLGRQFAIDAHRGPTEDPEILIFEPGTGEVLEVPVRFSVFHDRLWELREPALAYSFFEAWSVGHAFDLPLRLDQCVGYDRPLYLGGTDDLSNLSLLDTEVYWTLSGQLLAEARGLPPGARIGAVRGQQT